MQTYCTISRRHEGLQLPSVQDHFLAGPHTRGTGHRHLLPQPFHLRSRGRLRTVLSATHTPHFVVTSALTHLLQSEVLSCSSPTQSPSTYVPVGGMLVKVPPRSHGYCGPASPCPADTRCSGCHSDTTSPLHLFLLFLPRGCPAEPRTDTKAGTGLPWERERGKHVVGRLTLTRLPSSLSFL